MKIELHLLQSFAPGNLNRDDTGNPKDCTFGGFRRARISSQSLKRSIRLNPLFSEIVGSKPALRTRHANKPLVETLVGLGIEKNAAEFLGQDFFNRIVGWDETAGRTKVLLFFSGPEIEEIAKRLAQLWHEKLSTIYYTEIEKQLSKIDESKTKKSKKDEVSLPKEWNDNIAELIKQLKKKEFRPARGVEVALFGRMLAEEPGLNVDAACQVAHAISTHKLDADFDYFTAVDDLLDESEESGAGMIGNIGFNASCFYRFSVVDVKKLEENLMGDLDLVLKGTIAFIRSSIHSIPGAKQNTFAAHNKPSFIMVVVRKNNDAPVSLANAFLKPVKATEKESLLEASVRHVENHWDALTSMYGLNDDTQVLITQMKDLPFYPNFQNYYLDSEEALINQLTNAMLKHLNELYS
ncbi:MAG: type I-E CRISPR-associated protein Cas7/Cse4/CasC [Bacteroidetes bacterium]|nr:type I-E CRISPR-associated protein Cas7/Cse4/CasC [Bacteroidota bacterium]